MVALKVVNPTVWTDTVSAVFMDARNENDHQRDPYKMTLSLSYLPAAYILRRVLIKSKEW